VPSSPYDPVGLFDAEVTDAVLRSIGRAVLQGYQEAFRYCQENFSRGETHDVLPQLRRAAVERNVRSVLVRYAPRVKVAPRLNKTHNAWHNEIAAGRVVMTVNAVTNPGDMVRDAEFRCQYARDCQGNLFGTEGEEPAPDAPLFAVLLHGPEPKQRGAVPGPLVQSVGVDGEPVTGVARRRMDRPAFFQVAFPDKDLARYIGDPIDLLRRFPDLGDEGDAGAQPVPQPVVPPVSIDKVV